MKTLTSEQIEAYIAHFTDPTVKEAVRAQFAANDPGIRFVAYAWTNRLANYKDRT